MATVDTRAVAPPLVDLVRWFDQISLQDVARVGGKNASLGGAADCFPPPGRPVPTLPAASLRAEMYRELTHTGVRVPNGFAITSDAYFYFLDAVRYVVFVLCSFFNGTARPTSGAKCARC